MPRVGLCCCGSRSGIRCQGGAPTAGLELVKDCSDVLPSLRSYTGGGSGGGAPLVRRKRAYRASQRARAGRRKRFVLMGRLGREERIERFGVGGAVHSVYSPFRCHVLEFRSEKPLQKRQRTWYAHQCSQNFRCYMTVYQTQQQRAWPYLAQRNLDYFFSIGSWQLAGCIACHRL